MKEGDAKAAGRRIRPIKTKRDFEAVTAVVKKFVDKSNRDTVAEQRMQQLLKELDRADDFDDDDALDVPAEQDYPGPGRRWSDLTSD